MLHHIAVPSVPQCFEKEGDDFRVAGTALVGVDEAEGVQGTWVIEEGDRVLKGCVRGGMLKDILKDGW